MPFKDAEARKEYYRELMRRRRGSDSTAGEKPNVAPAPPSPKASGIDIAGGIIPPAQPPAPRRTYTKRQPPKNQPYVSCETGFGQLTTVEGVASALQFQLSRKLTPWGEYYYHDPRSNEHQHWTVYRNESVRDLPGHPAGTLFLILEDTWGQDDLERMLRNHIGEDTGMAQDNPESVNQGELTLGS